MLHPIVWQMSDEGQYRISEFDTGKDYSYKLLYLDKPNIVLMSNYQDFFKILNIVFKQSVY